MNKEISKHFCEISDTIRDYLSNSEIISNDYNEKVEHNNNRFNEDFASEANNSARKTATEKIDYIYYKAAETLKTHKSSLQEELNKYIAEPGNENVLSRLRTIKEFGLDITADEIKNYIASANGNYITLRAIEAVSNEKGFSIDGLPNIEEFNKDLKRLGNIADILRYAGNVSKDLVPGTYEHENVKYQVNSLVCIMRGNIVNAYLKNIQDVSNRWSSDVQPNVKAILNKISNGEISNKDELAEQAPKTSDSVELKPINSFANTIIQDVKKRNERAKEVQDLYFNNN